MLIVLLATCLLLILSPDVVPVHYNLAGEIDRMGSKYEFLLFPAESIGIGLFFTWMAKKHQQNPADEKALVISGICVLSLLGFLGIYFQTAALLYDPASSGMLRLKVLRLTVMAIGAMLVILGNFMPKTRRNAHYGLRTGWSMSSDAVWQKSQRFSGYAAVVCGTLMILLAAFFDGILCLVMSAVLVLVWLILSVWMSYRYYRAEKQ